VRVVVGSEEHAEMIKASLEADGELRPDKNRHSIAVEGDLLVVHFWASDVRSLRVAVSAFYDYAAVAVRTLQEFAE
jgi:tRNA threonylcarbamoyladenosine modification (KEOPS) complex  Pcc1 subunit